jgi:hypothetical protein
MDITSKDACKSTLMTGYGDVEGNKIMADARAPVVKLGPKVAQHLDATQLGNSPAVLMALAAYPGATFTSRPRQRARN